MNSERILVVFDDSSAGRRALEEAASIADQRRAELSVVAMVDHDSRQVGCCIPSGFWNGLLDELALGDLGKARDLIGARQTATSFDVAPGTGTKGVGRIASSIGCDLVVVPQHGVFGRLSLRRLRRRTRADVVGIRA